MSGLVKLTIDGRAVEVPTGTLLINAAKMAGIEIPAFCYYEGLSLQAACRMCLVEIEKSPKLVTSCTMPVAEGMVVHTNTPQVVEARKSMLEFILTNHPLDCPVCDKGGECELQDLTFRYGVDVSRFTEFKYHVPEKQWSPIVYFDKPRCILCYRCVRICKEGMGVGALGVVNRGVVSEITPNHGDHLECDECGMCIDICPVGALTSGIYRYKTRPWEMKHVGTACAHCADGCTTTLGVYDNRVIRGNNQDRSGVNGEFLCVKGRYAFDFVSHEERLRTPLIKKDGRFEEVSWSEALRTVAKKFDEIRARGGKLGVIGSTRTTNEENLYLQELARRTLGTNHIDHRRSGDVAALLAAVGGRPEALARTEDLYHRQAAVVIGADLAQQHPLLAFQLRANWRHHRARVYVVTRGPVREDSYAALSVRAEPGNELAALEGLRGTLKNEPELVILFGDSVRGEAVYRLVEFGASLGIPVKYVCLVGHSNSRGAMDMGLMPDFLPGYRPVQEEGLEPGLTLPEMLDSPDLDALWIVGANALRKRELAAADAFVVVQDLFLTETAQKANVVLPAASTYEKTGTVTNTCGELIGVKRAVSTMGAKTDLDIFRNLAVMLGAEIAPPAPSEIYAHMSQRGMSAAPGLTHAGLMDPANDTLFTSGTLGRYSKILNSLKEAPGELYRWTS
ncbi:MAG: NADH-quinone oxidoreductase subunit NuoG [Bryobacteraceae bacterium]|nr:NADH-quinone oxidoreductase subunit NuoG [Bryobacteraceae bacterium]